jgi:hypothetical protein
VKGRRCRNGIEGLIPWGGRELIVQLHVPGDADGEQGAACAKRRQRPVIVATALTETVARAIGRKQGHEKHVGADEGQAFRGLGNAAEARLEIGCRGGMEGKWLCTCLLYTSPSPRDH